MSNTVSNEELDLYENSMAKCLHCNNWYDITGEEPLTEFSCQSCGSLVLTPFRISEYWLYDLIGEGGMGFVYLAQKPGDLNHYAIKIATMDDDDNFRFESLLYEGEIYIELEHPNIPKAHRFGYKHGVAFLIMDYEFGYTLDEYLHLEGVFPIQQTTVLHWMTQLVEALKSMYDKGYIYRDLKPQNILVDGERAILTDMGLCMHMDHHKDIDEDNFVGSPSYLPPERVDAKPEDLRSDMYSLGMLIFFTICGHNYFEASDHQEVLEMHVNPERPAVTAVNAMIDPGFGIILDRLICLDPLSRYQSYDDLLVDLKALAISSVNAPV